MKKLSLLLAVLFTASFGVSAQDVWKFDVAHSNIKFNVEHLVISEVSGQFKAFDGELKASNEDFSGSEISFTIEVNSIDTENEKRDGHLKSDDFFSAEKFPNITFVGKALEKVDGKKYKLTGDLTIRDVTKTVELDVKYGGTIKDPWGNTKAGFKISGSINRFDYGLKWNNAMEAGGLVVGEDVEIICNVELQKQS
ncbi:MAG: YceI family protein [Cyclobacteriaceae bacterium]